MLIEYLEYLNNHRRVGKVHNSFIFWNTSLLDFYWDNKADFISIWNMMSLIYYLD